MDGARVLMLEAGRRYEPASETPMMQVNAEAPLRGAGTPEKPFGFWDATIDGGWQVPGEPYTSASDDPARQFQWWRAQDVRRAHQSLGPHQPAQRTLRLQAAHARRAGLRLADDYEDLAPYYDKVEMLIGVYGVQRRPGEHAALLGRRAAAAAQAARQRPAGQATRRARSACR